MTSRDPDNGESGVDRDKASPLRIGLVTPSWPGDTKPNGIATSVRHLAGGLAAIGHRPVIVALSQDGPGPKDIPVVSVPPPCLTPWQKIGRRLGRKDMAIASRAAQIAGAVEDAAGRHGLDVLVMEETQGWALAVIARRIVPVVVALHGPWLLHRSIQSDGDAAADVRRLDREAALFRAADALFAPSRNVLAAVEGAVDLGAKPRTVIPNPVAVGATGPIEGPPRILFVGRFDRHKGGDTVIDAFERLWRMRPDARLTFVGPDRGVRNDQGEVLSLEDKLSRLPGEARAAIEVLGQRTASEVARLRATHPIALIASRYENMNYTLLEAMASGQAVVSTDVGGPGEVLEDGLTGRLVPSEDPQAMAHALSDLLGDPGLARRLGAAARERAGRDFSPDAVAERMAAFVRRVR